MSGGKKPNKKNNLNIPKRGGFNHRVILGATLLVGILALGILIYSYLPTARIKKEIPLSEKVLADIGLKGYSLQKLPSVQIEYPSWMYAGDGAVVSMIFNPSGIQSGDSSRLVADFLMELDGSNLGPDGDILIPISNPFPAEATWNVVPFRGGVLSGRIWLHLQRVKSDGTTQTDLLIAYPLEIQSVVLMGGSALMIRLISIFLFFTSVLLLLIVTVRNLPPKQRPAKEP